MAVLSIGPSDSLFDSAEGWHRFPRDAFVGLLTHTDFACMRHPRAQGRSVGKRMHSESVKVYCSMFCKYLRHIEGLGTTVLQVTPSVVGQFTEGVLIAASRETHTRYVRLLERVYSHLLRRGFVQSDPVADWLQQPRPTDALRVHSGVPAPPQLVTSVEVDRLQEWLYSRGQRAIGEGEWRRARDTVIAALSLGTGMRCFEVLALSKQQVKHRPGAAARERFEFDIPLSATVPTAREHTTATEAMSADLMEAWWQVRWRGFRTRSATLPFRVPAGACVFPSNFAGDQMEKSTLFKALRQLAAEAVGEGVLSDRTRWVLERGAQGLRRAYVLSEIERGESLDLISQRLGHLDRRSVNDYRRDLRAGLTVPAGLWDDDPRQAFLTLVTQPGFVCSPHHQKRVRAAGQRIRPESAKVYVFMFGKYLRHLEDLRVTVRQATPKMVDQFFAGPLREAARETCNRYERLLERVYQELLRRGLVQANPVSQWLIERAEKPLAPLRRAPTPPQLVSAAEVDRLQDWLYSRGRHAIDADDWRGARDITIASVTLGSGMRCFELLVLSKAQVKYHPCAAARDRFEFDIPSRATVRTARVHDTATQEICADLMQAWWQLRWRGFPCRSGPFAKRVAAGDRVFPSNFAGHQMEKSTLFKALRQLATQAVEHGILNEATRWVLDRGAQGLRRAYVLTEIERGESLDLLWHRLGHLYRQPVEDYERELRTGLTRRRGSPGKL